MFLLIRNNLLRSSKLSLANSVLLVSTACALVGKSGEFVLAVSRCADKSMDVL